MIQDEGKIWYGIGLNTSELQRDATRAGSIFNGISKTAESEAGRIDSAYQKVTKTIAAVGGTVALGAAAKELYDFSRAFDNSMKEVATISDIVTNNMDGFKQQVLELGTKVPIAADAAGKALYQIVSAGYDGAAGMTLLEVSAKSAIAGMTNTTTAADAITTLLNAYKLSAGDAANISDQLFMTAKLGKTTFGELGQSISQAAPIAASFGIETEQVLAAVATLTKSGTPTAQAMTQIRAAIIGASKELGDGYFKIHTFQEGLAEIARRANGSESELRKLMPEIEGMNGVLGLTGINAQMAASDLAALGGAAGETEKAFVKMNDSADNQLIILKNNMLKKFQAAGDGMLDVVGDVSKYLNSAFDSGAIDDIIATIGVLIATIGTYKASMMVASAVKLAGNNLVYSVEIAELQKLLPAKQALANADIEQAVAKGHLSQATAERLITIRAEAQAELDSLRVKEKALIAKVADATKEDALALKQALNAERRERAAQSELSQAMQSGNAQKIRRAEIKLTLAEEELNIALKNKEVTANALVSTSSKAKSAATAVDTMQTNLNTVSVRSATTAKTLWTAATKGLTKAFHSLKLAFASNPIGMILTGVTMAISLFSMFKGETEDLEDATDVLSKSITELGIAMAKESQEIDDAFSKLAKAKKGTQEYGDAKDHILSKYSKYLDGLSSEARSLDDVALAYQGVKKAAEESLRARFKSEFIEGANKEASTKMGAAMNSLLSGAKNSFSDDFLQKYPEQINAINSQITAALTDVTKTAQEKKIEVGAILEDFGLGTAAATRIMHRYDSFGNIIGSFVKDFDDNFQNMLGTEKLAEEAFTSFADKQEDGGVQLETVSVRRAKLARELVAETVKLSKMTAGNSTSSDTEIQEQEKKVKALKAALGSATASSVNDHSGEVREAMLKAEQMKIDIMQEGRIKELAQIEQTRKEKLAALDKEQKEIEANLKKQGKKLSPEETATFADQRNSIGVSADHGAAAVNKKYDDEISDHWKALTAVFLSEEQKRTGAIKDRYDQEREWADKAFANIPILGSVFKMQIDASEAKEQLDALTADYQTYADRRKKIEEKYNADIAALRAKNTDGKLDGNIKEAENQKKAALSKVNLDEASAGVDLTKLFGNLDNLTLPSQKELRDKIKAWIDSAGKDLKPEDLKAVSDAFNKLELNIADKDPFAVLKTSAHELKISTTAVKEAQEAYNKALKENGEDSAAAILAAETLTKAQNDRAASVAKTNEALNSIGEKGQQAVGAAQDIMGIMNDLGVKVPEQIAEAISGIGDIMSGLASIDLTSPMSIITGSIKVIGGLIKTVGAFFNGDNKRQAEIQRLQGEIDALTKSYEALEKAIDKAYSVDASNQIGQSDELLRKQRALINQQIREEEGKKDSDGGQIDEWRKQIEEIDAQLEENREKAVDVIFGSDVESAIDDFASAYMDAWAAGEDRAQAQKDVVKNMIRGIIQEMLKSDIKEQVEAMRKKIAGFMEDDVLSDDELAQIDSMGEQIGKIMEQRGKMYDKILKDEELKNEDSFTGAIRGTVATEASVAELKGYYAGQFDKLASIDNRLAIGFQGLVEMARTNAQIEANTRATAANTAATVERLTAGFGDMSAKLTNIDNNTKKDNGSY